MASNNYNKSKSTTITQTHPKMLKDFLQENTIPTNYDPDPNPNPNPTIQLLLDQPKLPTTLSRSRTALSSFRRLLNTVVKSLHHSTTSSPPALLSRSLSGSLLERFSRNKSKSKTGNSDNVIVKDILKWRSFRDLVVEDPIKCSDVLFQDNVVNVIITVNNSNNESELESEPEPDNSLCYTMDELPCWWGNLIEERKIWDYNNDVGATVRDIEPKEDGHSIQIEDGKEQHSPISVLDSPFGDEISDQEFESSFDKSFANMERTKQSLLQSIQWLENLAGVSDNEDDESETIDLSQDDNAIGPRTKVNRSRAIVKLKKEGRYLKSNEMCIKDMENEGHWSKFEDEKDELVIELEILVLSELLDDICDDKLKLTRCTKAVIYDELSR